MQQKHKHVLIIGLASVCIAIFLLLVICCFCRKKSGKDGSKDIEVSFERKSSCDSDKASLIRFSGGEDLTVSEILDAPGEVIGKSSYGTLYRATLLSSDHVALLRFLRPTCTMRMKEVVQELQILGSTRHPNLIPLYAFYAGARGENLLLHPFYHRGNLAQFIRDENNDSYKWSTVYAISIGIARGLDYLHTGLQKPLIHGNLKSKNILLDLHYQPRVSDFGLHPLLNPTAGQEILVASAAQGYKAPELIKMKDASEETDVYSLGVILLELLTGREPLYVNPTPDQDFYLPNFMRDAIFDHQLTNLYHPAILLGQTKEQVPVTEERILKFFQLAVACCSPSPSLRPNIKQILRKLEEIGE